jgi:hypothetical protein
MIQAQQGNFTGLQRDLLDLLNNLLRQHNPYVTSFKMAYKRIAENPDLRLHLPMVDTRAHDPRRYNRPISNEIAGMIVGNENPEWKASKDIVIEHQRNGFPRVSELNPSYFPLRYPFMFLMVNKDGTLISHCHALTSKPIPSSLLGIAITFMLIAMTTCLMTAMMTVVANRDVGEVAQPVSRRLSFTIIISNGEPNSHLCNTEDV